MELSVVIPVYNEEAILEQSLNEIVSFFTAQKVGCEFIAVNDGSTDGTKSMLERIQPDIPNFAAIHFSRNRGKGAAVREGFLKSRGDYMFFMDSDLSVPLSSFGAFWQARAPGKILIGSRALAESVIRARQFFLREWAGKMGNALTRMVLPLSFRDTQCGFKMFPGSFRALLDISRISGAAFDIEWLLIAYANGYAIEDVPLMWSNRPSPRFDAFAYIGALKDVLGLSMRYYRGAYRRA